MYEELLKNSIGRLAHWIEQNGMPGLDPYTLQAELFRTNIYKRYKKYKAFRYISYHALQSFPDYLLPVLKPQVGINAKGLGLISRGYINLYYFYKEADYIKTTRNYLDWLMANRNHSYCGYSWGYPFDWNSDIFIPKNTPSSVVTVTVGYAFLDMYQITWDNQYLKVIQGIVEFLLNGLNRHQINDDEVCFSYTPLDDKHVLNSNLFVGDFLARASKIIKNNEWEEVAKQIYLYTINRQNSDGSFYYYGPEQNTSEYFRKLRTSIDHYHLGFVLRTLKSIANFLQIQRADESIGRGLQFYLDEMYDDFIPKYMPNKKYPVNIHSISEALLVLNLFRNHPAAKNKLIKLLPWAIKQFQDKTGYFYYNVYWFRKVRIPYLRWGQGWMFYALTELLKDASD